MSASPAWLNVPNKITIARFLIAAALFALLTIEIQAELDRPLVLNLAVVIFSICVATDWLDGYLARRWGMVTTFGRIADPFVDKVVICGTFVYLVRLAPDIVHPWFAVIIIAREFLVTSLRSYLESQGTPFGARWGGKIKMVVQCFAIPTVMFTVANFRDVHSAWATFFHGLSILLVTITLIATLVSAWDYVALSIRSLDTSLSSSTAEPGTPRVAATDPRHSAAEPAAADSSAADPAAEPTGTGTSASDDERESA